MGLAIENALRGIEQANQHFLYGIFGDAQWSNKNKLSDRLLIDLIEHLKVLSASGEKAWFQDWGEKQVSISQNLSYQIVVLSSGNINKNLLDLNYQIAQKLEHIQMYLLTQGSHLNMYRDDDIDKLVINDMEFERLIIDTKTALEF